MFPGIIRLLNKPLQPSLQKYGYHEHIEQYRGLCALFVLLNHGGVHEDMLLDNFRWPEWVNFLGSGYLSVIVFFCISGYVIGLTNNHNTLNIKLYIKRRLVRLYPIYLVALVMCIIAAGGVGLFELAGNLVFLQNSNAYVHFVMPLFVNFPTWSLNYEVVYYILFVGIFFLRPRVWILLLCMLVLSIYFINDGPQTSFFVQYLNGFYFWAMGLMIGWGIINGKDNNAALPLLSLLFLHLCHQYIGVGYVILHIAHINSNSNFNWIFDLPFCLMIMCTLTKKDNTFLRINKFICYLIPGIIFGYLVLNHRIFENVRWIMCLIFWALALALYNEKKVSAVILEKLTGVGKISYALYIFHVPVAALIKKTIFINNQTVEVTVKYLLWIIITFGLAMLFELIVQPKIKNNLIPAGKKTA